jgi:hypothetical protein
LGNTSDTGSAFVARSPAESTSTAHVAESLSARRAVTRGGYQQSGLDRIGSQGYSPESMSALVARPSALAKIVALAAFFAGGCSADAVVPPEPEVETPGAIFVMHADEVGLQLMQTQGSTGLGMGDIILFVDIFQAEPVSFEEARALARDPSLPVRTKDYFITLRTVLSAPHEVVWFRSIE